MERKKKVYAPRLNTDPVARKQLAILRLAGVPHREIAKICKRSVKSITDEFKRSEHKKLMRQYTLSLARLHLPRDAQGLIEKALNENEKMSR